MLKHSVKQPYEVIGTGSQTVVWLHGFLENRSMWHGWSAQFPTYKHILIDLPGHGEAPVLDMPATMDNLSDYVHHILVQHQVENPVMVGHSLGGYVALAYQERYKNAKALVLAHSTFLPDSEEKQRNRDRVIDVVRQNKLIFIRESIPGLFVEPQKFETVISVLVEQATSISSNAIIATLQGMKIRPERTHVMSQLPAYVVSGIHDTAIDLNMLQERLTGVPSVQHHVLQHAAHMGMYEQPETFGEILSDIFVEIFNQPLQAE